MNYQNYSNELILNSNMTKRWDDQKHNLTFYTSLGYPRVIILLTIERRLKDPSTPCNVQNKLLTVKGVATGRGSWPVGKCWKNAIRVRKIRLQKRENTHFCLFLWRKSSKKKKLKDLGLSVEKFVCPSLLMQFTSLPSYQQFGSLTVNTSDSWQKCIFNEILVAHHFWITWITATSSHNSQYVWLAGS